MIENPLSSGFFIAKERSDSMNAKQERFCEEYLIDLNATQAAIRAGYSSKTANEQGCRLLTNVSIRARIDEEMAKRSARTGVNADRIIRELARIAFFKATDAVHVNDATLKSDISDDDAAVIASIKVRSKSGEDFEETEREIKFADKLKALELLGKHNNMFNTENINLTGEVEIKSDKLDKILEQLKDDG